MAVTNVLLVSGSANFSTRDVWDGYRVGLEMHGINVVPYPTFSFLKVLSPDSVCSDIIGTALDVTNAIDCVVFIDGLYFRGNRARVPLSIRRAGLPTVLVATDDPYEPIPETESLYTYRFTNELNSATFDVPYLPTASASLPALPRVESPAYDVSFLGTLFEERMPMLIELAHFCEEQRLRFVIAGKFVKGTEAFRELTYTELRPGTIENPQKWEIYAQSLVTLNLFRPSELPAASPSPRIFEATAFGHAAVLSGPPRTEVRRLFGDTVYEFDDANSAKTALRRALDDPDRMSRVDRAREITLEEHTYEHRAATLVSHLRSGEELRDSNGAAEDRVAWIVGCGRSGSTWLAEMLGDLPRIRRWHEPYFGRFFRHVHDRPQDLDRKSSFFAERHRGVLLDGLRDVFFRMVRDRYPRFGEHGLVVKEVNTPELYGWLRLLFPTGRMIFLKRDPFDVLDSYLDLQKPGSWNENFGAEDDPLEAGNVRRTAEHIRAALSAALDAFNAFPPEQRLQVAYEDLLSDAVPHLARCGELISCPVEQDAAARVVETHRFQRYKQTGPLAFRRRGEAGVWKESPNFRPEILQIARDVLGVIRERLGYADTGQLSPL